ncbi:AEC family transporter [Candidatus Sumerlaeota bacterium]|nr:AEC family transporter [Candidatus Sumerlaeota bacterium]
MNRAIVVVIVLAIAQVFGIFAVGWIARWRGYVREEELGRWSRFVIDILFPFLAFDSIVRGFDRSRFVEFAILPFLALGIIVFSTLAGLVLRRGLRTRDVDIRKTFLHLCAINNYGFLPIIIVQNLIRQGQWGEIALAQLFIFNLGSTIGYWTIGVWILGGAKLREGARHLLTPNILAVFLALAVCLTGLNRFLPSLLLQITGAIGQTAVPIILLLIGATLYPLPSFSNGRDVAYATFLRLGVIPLLVIGILSLLPISRDAYRLILIIAVMPAAVSATILTRRYGGSPDFAASAAVSTTVLSVATVPLLIRLFW